MKAAVACSPLDRLHDGPLSCIGSECTHRDDWQSLSLTCQRLCRVVRSSRRFKFRLGLQDAQQLQQVPASRAWQQVESLSVTLEPEDLQPGCWEALAGVLSSSVQRWVDIPEMHILGTKGFHTREEEPGCLAAPLAALKGAAALRRLSLVNVADTSDLPHLEQLTQVTALHMCDESPKYSMPLVLDDPVSAPLAALTNLQRLELESICALTHEGMQPAVDDSNCPLALPPNLTALKMLYTSCSGGTLWRHIAACSALEDLELPENAQAFDKRDHPSWALHELAGSLGRLKRLTIGSLSACSCEHMTRLLHLLYMPQPEEATEEEMAAAAPLAQLPAPVAGMAAFGPHTDRMLLPPPNMAGFSSLEMLELPGGTHYGWWLMCSAAHHWEALAGCTALRQLQALHASQPPPAGVDFLHVTQLEVTVAPGDTIQVLGAFPALQELAITSVVQRYPAQKEPAASQLEQPQPAPHPSAAHEQLACPSVTALKLALHAPGASPFDSRASSASSSSRSADPQAVVAYCSDLWLALPGLREVELLCPQGVSMFRLPSFTPLTGLTSLQLHLDHHTPATVEQWAGMVAGVSKRLQGVRRLQRLVLTTDLQWPHPSQRQNYNSHYDAYVASARATCGRASKPFSLQLGEGSWEDLVQQVRHALPKLQELQLQCI